MLLIQAIVSDNVVQAKTLINSSSTLSSQNLSSGATRQRAADFYLEEIGHYLVSGDTPLHAAAAGYRLGIAKILVTRGARVEARNRRGAEPLHYAADGGPGLRNWDPMAQFKMIDFLVRKGADPNGMNINGVTPLHRAVRQRCAKAVESLLRNGANVRLKNKNGSTPLHLAVQNTGRGGTGSQESKNQQREIIKLLLGAGADPGDHDGRAKTVRQSTNSEWIISLLSASD